MQLTEAQINKFKEIHKPYGGLKDYSDEQIVEIANGVAAYFNELFIIYSTNTHGRKTD